MKTDRKTYGKFFRRKAATILLLTVSALGAFATLGDGKIKGKGKSILSNQQRTTPPRNFSLRSGYDYRGSQLLNPQSSRFITINTTVTYQRGNTTYIVPIQKKVNAGKVKFGVGIQQLNK